MNWKISLQVNMVTCNETGKESRVMKLHFCPSGERVKPKKILITYRIPNL